MTTQEFIIEINKVMIKSLDDFITLERIDKLTDLLRMNSDGYLTEE
ncbi:hypothetical protein SAMN04487898_105313 [Pedobacter sp. ok626]|nr:hypothetical protein SAMN04487898_105313 [Pedobacter sp. ok626]